MMHPPHRPLQTVLVLALSAGSLAAAAPEDTGPLAVETSSVMAPVGGGAQLATDLYFPQAGGPFPALVLRHGFLRSKQNFVNWGKHLASRGFVAIIPTSRAPAQPNPAVDSDDMLALLVWARAQSQQPGSPLHGKVDGERLAVVGHSAGGLASALAASKDSTLRAAVLLDPVDVGAGAPAAPATKVPVAVLLAEPGVCNVQGNYLPIFPTFGGPRFGLKVIGAQHCAPEDPSDGLCAIACGGTATAEQRTAFRRYATAFLEAYLSCDATAFPYVGGAAAQADPAIALLPQSQGLTLPPAGCSTPDGPPRDGSSVATRDAGRLDRSSAGEGSAPRDAQPGEALSAGPGQGCGCGAAGAGAAPPLAIVLAVVLLSGCSAAGAVRRRAQRRRSSTTSPSSSTSASPRRGPTSCRPTGSPSA